MREFPASVRAPVEASVMHLDVEDHPRGSTGAARRATRSSGAVIGISFAASRSSPIAATLILVAEARMVGS